MTLKDTAAFFADLSDETFLRWKHSPVTAAFFAFLADQRDNFQFGAGVLVCQGTPDPASPSEDLNPHIIRGKWAALDGISRLTLGEIQQFYVEATEDAE